MPPTIAFVGVSHWHSSIYAGILKELGMVVAGTSDPDAGEGAAAAAALGLAFEADAATMLARVKPDLVFVTPRHDRVLETLRPALASGRPIVIEKPMGLNGAGAHAVADAIEAAGLWATAALPNRHLGIWARVAEMRAAGALGTVTHAHFRLINGPPQRYPAWGVGWMLEPAKSGGGCLRNLGIHTVDAVRLLAGPEIEVMSGALSHRTYGLEVEEFAAAMLRVKDGPVCTVESGYSYAAAGGDFEWRIAATGAYLQETKGLLSIRHADGRLETQTTQDPSYKPMVEAALAALASGAAPACPVRECAEAVALCDAIYRAGGREP
jgi:predicted dehydrogenase